MFAAREEAMGRQAGVDEREPDTRALAERPA